MYSLNDVGGGGGEGEGGRGGVVGCFFFQAEDGIRDWSVTGVQTCALPTPRRSHRWAKVTIPVDLRRLFESRTLRNFALTVNVGVDPRLGAYSLDELCSVVQGQLAMQVTPQQMAARVAANVNPEQALMMKVAPLPLKNLAMRLVYRTVGECKGTLNISNLGLTRLPRELAPHVACLDFIIGPQLTYFNNCSVISWGGLTRINLIRSLRQPELERRFLTKLVALGLEVTVDSNEGRE